MKKLINLKFLVISIVLLTVCTMGFTSSYHSTDKQADSEQSSSSKRAMVVSGSLRGITFEEMIKESIIIVHGTVVSRS